MSSLVGGTIGGEGMPRRVVLHTERNSGVNPSLFNEGYRGGFEQVNQGIKTVCNRLFEPLPGEKDSDEKFSTLN